MKKCSQNLIKTTKNILKKIINIKNLPKIKLEVICAILFSGLNQGVMVKN